MHEVDRSSHAGCYGLCLGRIVDGLRYHPSVSRVLARSTPCITFRRFVWDAWATHCVAACVGALGHTQSGLFGDTIRGIVEKGGCLGI